MTRLPNRLPATTTPAIELDNLPAASTAQQPGALGTGLFDRSRTNSPVSAKPPRFAPGEARSELRRHLLNGLIKGKGYSEEQVGRIMDHAPQEQKRLEDLIIERSDLKSQIAALKQAQARQRGLHDKASNATIEVLNSRIKVIDSELRGVHLASFHEVVSNALAGVRASNVVKQQRAHTRMSRIAAKFEGKPYKWPVQTGKLSLEGAHLRADEANLHRIVSTYTTDPAVAAELKAALSTTGAAADLKMASNPEMDLWYRGMKAYAHICEVPLCVKKGASETEFVNIAEKEDEKDPNSEEVGVDASVLLFNELINRGSDAFGDNARVMNRVIADPAKVKIHPSAYAAEMVPRFTSSNKAVEAALNKAAANHPGLTARMAGSSALERATQTDYAIVPWIMSVGLSGIAGFLLENLAGDASLHALFAKKMHEAGLDKVTEEMIAELGSNPEKFIATLVKTYPFMPIEALDTLIVLSALDVIEGAKLTMSKVLGRLPSALKAGMVSLLMGLPDKATDLIENIGARAAAQIVTSPVSVMACAFGVFAELGEDMYKSRAAVFQMYQSGMLAWPKTGDAIWPEGVDLQNPKSVEKFIVAQTEAMLNLAPKSSIGRASIPMSVMISWMLVLMSGVKSKLAPDAVPALINMLKIIFFNPIEVWTLNINVFVEHRSVNKEFKQERARIVVQYKNSLTQAKRAEFERSQNAEWEQKIAAATSPEERQELVSQRDEAKASEAQLALTEHKHINAEEARTSMFQIISATTMTVADSMTPKKDAATAPPAAAAPKKFAQRVNERARDMAISSADKDAQEANIVGISHSRNLAKMGGFTITTAYDLMSATVGRFAHEAVPAAINTVFRTNLDAEDKRMKVLMPYAMTSDAWNRPVEEIGIDGERGIGMTDMSRTRQPEARAGFEDVAL
ncbi:MAG: hypothetical protein ACRYGK_04535 [Janthinobacterium lividum]